METITINIDGHHNYKPSEIISDLRIAAETLYCPMKFVGFWDYQKDMHLCPQIDKHQSSPHSLDENDAHFVSYSTTLERERNATLAMWFPHANITLYLS